MRAIPSSEMRALEDNSEYLGVTRELLMECAGAAVAREVLARAGPGRRVVVVAGPGNNGGDGMVAARHLSWSCDVTVVLVSRDGRMRTPEAEANRERVARDPSVRLVVVRDPHELEGVRDEVLSADVVVDALFGTGLRGEVSGLFREVIELVNSSRGLRVAVDAPSGLDPDSGEVRGTAVRAHVTVTFHAPKAGLLKEGSGPYVGELVVAPIGIPRGAELLCGPGDVRAVYRTRPPWSKKGDFGRILVVGGSRDFSGAPALSALAAMRTGADLVIVACPAVVAPVVRSYSPALIVRPVGEEYLTPECLDPVVGLAERSDAVVLGPGMGAVPEALEFARELVARLRDRPLVLDADGLKAVEGDPSLLGRLHVMTPHAGEFRRVFGFDPGPDEGSRARAAARASEGCECTILLKGHVDIIARRGRYKLNRTGNPGMTVGGTGDVLTGVLATLLAWSRDPFRSACAAAFINGLAGDLARRDLGYHLTPLDVVERIPAAFMECGLT